MKYVPFTFFVNATVFGRSAETANKLRQLAGQLCKWAMREGIITTNWAQFLIIPAAKKKEKATFTKDEIESIKADGSDTAKVVTMMIYTGVRVGEMFDLALDDWHETYCIGGSKTEAGRNRVIPIPENVRPLFAHFVAKAQSGGKLLDGYEGNKNPNNFRKRDWAELMERLGIEGKTPHSTRHTFASMAVQQGVKPEALQKILGHASYETTADIYVHSDADELVAEIAKIGGY